MGFWIIGTDHLKATQNPTADTPHVQTTTQTPYHEPPTQNPAAAHHPAQPDRKAGVTVGLSTRTGMRSRRGALKIGLVDRIEDPGRLAFVDTPDGVVS